MSKIIPIFQAEVQDGKLTIKTPVKLKDYLNTLRGAVEVLIRRPQRGRSQKANAYYWGVVLAVISFDTGFTVEEVHQIFKKKFLSYKKKYKGKEYPFVGSTAKLNSADFTDYIEKIKQFASAELNIFVPEAGEFSQEYNLEPIKE